MSLLNTGVSIGVEYASIFLKDYPKYVLEWGGAVDISCPLADICLICKKKYDAAFRRY